LVRSYSLDEFRPEILDAMFRICVVENSERQQTDASSGAAADMDSSSSKYRERPCIYPADPYRSVDDASFGYSTQNPRQFARYGYEPAYRPQQEQTQTQGKATDLRSLYEEQQRSLPPRAPTSRASISGPSSRYYTSPSGGSGGGSSSNPLHGVDIAAKFAEFKAKHLNNRDLAKVFSRRPKESAEEPLGMREAMVDAAEDEVDPDGAGAARGSVSGGGGGGSGGGTLKYMSSVLRSKFQAAMHPPSGEKDKGPGASP
jgi:hypothetical protein